MFQFQLKPIAECALPGDEVKTMSWFYLTDCWYSIHLDNTRLFYSSPQWQKKHPGRPELDYYYVRWLEDFWDILAQVTADIPPDLYALIASDESRQAAQAQLYRFWDTNEDAEEALSPELEELYLAAQKFLYHGCLDTGFLRFRSQCRFCRVGDQMTIHYDFRDQDEDGIPVWSAGAGQFRMPYRRFTEEIDNMLLQFFRAMEGQINRAVLEARAHPGKYWAGRDGRRTADPDQIFALLQAEQMQRKEDFHSAWNAAKAGQLCSSIDWAETRSALQQTGLLQGTASPKL